MGVKQLGKGGSRLLRTLRSKSVGRTVVRDTSTSFQRAGEITSIYGLTFEVTLVLIPSLFL